MRHILTCFALSVVMGFSPVALATDFNGHALAKFEMSKYGKSHDVIIYKIADVRSSAPTQDDFAIELGYKLNELTAQNGFENCATMCRAADGSNSWSARIITVRSQAFCPTIAHCDEGFKPAGVDIHSHLHVTRYVPNEIDRLQLLRSYGPRDHVSTYSDDFSNGDLSGDPGYMVSDRSVQFHEGHRKRKVWQLKDAPPISTLVANTSN